MFNLNATVLAA